MSKERITVTIPNILKTLAQPGDFVASGAAEIPLLRLAVDGVGLLGLPMNEPQVQALRAVATDAPYARGKDTLIDPHVRSCKQIHASPVHTEDPKYLAILSEIVSCCAERLGVDGGVEAELYKMLIYTEGDFFLEHRDTEKAPRMFATLVVVLPSEHTGGELIVRHGAREERPTLSGVELDLLRWAAFYADCKHELLPLRSGNRVALVYNLLRTHGPTLNAPDNSSVVDSLAKVLNTWGKKSGEPEKIVVP